MRRAVLDANVYVSAALRPEGPPRQIVERFLREAAFEVLLSRAIVDEVLRALAYPKVRKHLRRDFDAELWFEDIVLLAQLVAVEHEPAIVGEDPDDDKYIAAAIEGRADFIVSGDPHLVGIVEYEGIRIVTPRVFLQILEKG